jgi:transcription antitermination factor NusG
MSMQPAETYGLSIVKHSPGLLSASFPLGRAWFVVFASSAEMHWSKMPRKWGEPEAWSFPVVRRIENEGFETFVPRERRIIRFNGRKIERVIPLLGSYIFVRFDREADDWGVINPVDICGVHGLLRNADDLPIRVPDMAIEKLQRAEDQGAFDFTRPMSAFAEGEEVEILEGPFAGLIAKVRSCEPRKRAKLLLTGLGKLEIDPSSLRKRD